MATSIIKPVHAGIKQSFTLPTTAASWTAVTGGYKYTWTSSLVTEGCRVEVEFASTNTNNTTPYIEYEKTSGGGGIDFIVSSVPTTAIPVVATIICAQTGNTTDVKDTDVSTSTNISALGANVNEALSSLNSKIVSLPAVVDGAWFGIQATGSQNLSILFDFNVNKLLVRNPSGVTKVFALTQTT